MSELPGVPSYPPIPHEMLETTLAVLEEFAAELGEECEPPVIPYESEASTRGWSMRLETIREKLAPFTRAEVLVVCSRLARVLSVFDQYITAWDTRVAKVDPLLRDYEFMPGDFNAVDSVRILAERVNMALYDCVATHFGLDDGQPAGS